MVVFWKASIILLSSDKESKGVEMAGMAQQWKLLGGFTLIAGILFSFIPPPFSDPANLFLIFIFVVFHIRLLSKNKIRFLTDFAEKHPKISDYLSSVGWIAYFFCSYLLISFIYLFQTGNMALFEQMMFILSAFSYSAILLSLFICALRRSEKNNPSA